MRCTVEADVPKRMTGSALRSLPRDVLVTLVQGYRVFFSPWLGSGCRFEPTCSQYALQALLLHGAAAGTYLTVARLARCHPWCAGGLDGVPAQAPALFRHLFDTAPPGVGESSPTTTAEPNP